MKVWKPVFFDTQMSTDSITKNKVKLDSLLWQVRELCRKHKLNIWGNQGLANQIYQDLLFIYHVPALCVSGILELDVEYIGDGKLTEVSYKSLLSLKEPTHINTAFKRLWKQLQMCVLKPLFEGRDFVMFAIEKKDAKKYMTLLLDIMNYLASIELEKYDSNAGYTYFKKELNKAIAKTFGQFYTPSSVTASVVKQVDPKTGESVLDPSSGSCSFLAEAANHIAKSESVDMATAFKDLYGTEVEPNIYAEGVMNMFINFGILPDMNERIREVDALLDMAKNTMFFKKIVANPPFGADASSFLEWYYQTIIEPPTGKAKKGTKKVILNPEVKCEIPFPKISESAILFFQYIVQKLAPGGKAGVVMSATIFNDGFKDMMKWFLECCSLDKIIINPAGTFKEQGTGIETFSFIFTKGSPTTKIDIAMLGAEDDVVRSLTLDQIKEAGWKLQVKEEEKKVVYTGEYKLKRLGEICSFVNGHAFKSEDFIETGIPVVKITNIKSGGLSFEKVQYSKEDDTLTKWIVKPNDIVISLTGYPGDIGLNLTNVNWYLNQRVARIDITNTTIVNPMYMYYYMKYSGFRDSVKNISSGSAQPNVSTRNIEELEFPLPPIPIQEEIVATLDRIFADPQDMKDCLAFTDKAMDIMLKDPSGKLLEDVMGALRLKRAQLAAATSIKAQMAAVMRSVGTRGYEKKKVGNIASMNPENVSKNDPYTNIDYIDLSCVNEGILSEPQTFTFSERPGRAMRKVQDGDILWGTVRPLSRSYTFLDKVTANTIVSTGFVVIRNKDEGIISSKFLYYLLTTEEAVKYLSDHSGGSSYPAFKPESLSEYLISIPPLPVQTEVLAILNEMEAELKTMEQMAAKAEQRAKYILDGYLSSQPSSEPVQEIPVPVNEVIETPVAPVDAAKKKKTVIRLKKTEPVV